MNGKDWMHGLNVNENFTMYARKVNGVIHIDLSGRLDVSRASEILRFLHLYAREKCAIVVKTSSLSPDSTMSFDVLQKGLRRLSKLGHPIRQVGKAVRMVSDQGPPRSLSFE